MSKKTTASSVLGLRGAKLVKKAIEAGRSEALADPEPVAPAVLKKLVLPNGEPISAGMKELLKVDALWLGIEFDEDEGDIESTSLEELLEDELGKTGLATFNEAIEMLGGDCIPLGGVSDAVRFLYVGEADESGEYPVVLLASEPKPWVAFVPFDVWLAQELGALPAATSPGAIPEEYAEAAKALAEANGDGRVGFEPVAGERSDEDEEEDEDEDENDADDEDEDESDDEDVGEDEDEDLGEQAGDDDVAELDSEASPGDEDLDEEDSEDDAEEDEEE